jgi:hypothetical protein
MSDYQQIIVYLTLTGLSNQFEPSMVFDPSEFEGPKFDCIYFNGVPYFQEKNNSCVMYWEKKNRKFKILIFDF